MEAPPDSVIGYLQNAWWSPCVSPPPVPSPSLRDTPLFWLLLLWFNVGFCFVFWFLLLFSQTQPLRNIFVHTQWISWISPFLGHSSARFDKWIWSWTHYHNRDTEQSQHFRMFLCAFCALHSPHPQPLTTTDLFSIPRVLSFPASLCLKWGLLVGGGNRHS